MQSVTVKASIQIGGVVASRKTVTAAPMAIPGQLMRPDADRRQPLQQVVAQRQRLAADDEPDHDQDERHRGADAGLFDVARTSVWAIPITSPATSAIGKERKPATSAAAVAARTRLVSTAGCRVTIGTIRIAARPARPQPSAQLRAAIVSGESPSAEAERSDSATAAVARPKRV